MASVTELENLVVRMSADVSNLLKGMDQVKRTSTETASTVELATHKIEAFTGKVEGFGAGLERTLGMLGIAVGFKEALEKFEEFEKNAIRMEAVLQANERDVAKTTLGYKKFAKQMSETTLASKGQVLALLETAETFGLTGPKAEKAARDALAASKIVRDSSAEGLMRFSQAIASGDLERAKAYSRMIPQLRGVKDEQELLVKWNKLVAAGTNVMGKEMETSGAKIEKAKQQFGTLTREMGGVIAEGVGPLVRILSQAGEWFVKLDPQIKGIVAGMLALTAAVIAFNAAAPMLRVNLLALAANPVAWAAAAVAAIYLLGRGVANLSGATTEYNNRLRETEEHLAKISSEVPGGDMENMLNKQARLEYVQKLRAAEEARVRSKSILTQTVGESLGKTLEPFDKKIRELQDNARAAIEAQRKIDSGEQAAQDADKFIKKLKEESATIGMTEQEKERYKIATQHASEAVLAAVDAEIKYNKTLADSFKAREQLKSLTESLQDQINFASDMTEAEKQLEKIKRLSDEVAAGKEFAAAQDLAALAKRTDEVRKMRKEGEELAKQVASPAEKLQLERDRLQKMFDAGAISAEVYAKALANVQKGLDGVAASMRDAAGYGTAEARSRIAEFLDISHGWREFPNMAGGGQNVFSKSKTSRQMQLEGTSPYNPETGPTSQKAMSFWERITKAVEKTASREAVEVQPADLEE